MIQWYGITEKTLEILRHKWLNGKMWEKRFPGNSYPKRAGVNVPRADKKSLRQQLLLEKIKYFYNEIENPSKWHSNDNKYIPDTEAKQADLKKK